MKAHIMPHQWMARETIARPKARFLGFLAVIWAPVALLGALYLWLDTSGPESPGMARLAWQLLIPELVLVWMAIVFRFVECPRHVPPPLDWDGPEVP